MTENKDGLYAIQLIMDYGKGRQVQILGNLSKNATLKEFNEELDKLRLATNRQELHVVMRERQQKMNASKKMVVIIESLIAEYDKDIEKQMADMDKQPLHSTGKQRTQVSQAIENLRNQANNFRQQKMAEIRQHEGEITLSEAIIADSKREIDEIDKNGK